MLGSGRGGLGKGMGAVIKVLALHGMARSGVVGSGAVDFGVVVRGSAGFGPLGNDTVWSASLCGIVRLTEGGEPKPA